MAGIDAFVQRLSVIPGANADDEAMDQRPLNLASRNPNWRRQPNRAKYVPESRIIM
jgi:hypothetical protein